MLHDPVAPHRQSAHVGACLYAARWDDSSHEIAGTESADHTGRLRRFIGEPLRIRPAHLPRVAPAQAASVQ